MHPTPRPQYIMTLSLFFSTNKGVLLHKHSAANQDQEASTDHSYCVILRLCSSLATCPSNVNF